MGKVLLIASNFPPVRGGSASVYSNIVENAKDEVIVLAPYIDYKDRLPLIGWREHDMQFSGKVIRVPLIRAPLLFCPSKKAKLASRFQELRIITRVTYEMIKLILIKRVRILCVGELLSCAWIVHLFRFIPLIKTVVYIHGEELTTKVNGFDNHAKLRSTLLASDKVIVVSSFTKIVADGLLNQAPSKTVLIPNGVNTKRFKPGPKNYHLLQKYGISDCFVFVSVCRLVKKKGLDKSIEAFALFKNRLPRTKLLIVGGGPFHSHLLELVERLDLSQDVVFSGPIPEKDLVNHYLLGDVFIMPNRAMPDGDTEGFGLVFLEANSCGLPVIAGRDGGSSEAVQDGISGLVVDGRSTAEIGEAMLKLRHSQDLRLHLIRGGRLIADKASWRSRTEVFMKVVSDLQTLDPV